MNADSRRAPGVRPPIGSDAYPDLAVDDQKTTDSQPDAALARTCPECLREMVLAHQGRFTTVYSCVTCGCRLTIPPDDPLISRSP
jgi:hydrogenase maturation factor HypF (carbamoyltransferase family)